ncbi:hypothetical protein EJB05_12598, partial [Eragrostis curvula]
MPPGCRRYSSSSRPAPALQVAIGVPGDLLNGLKPNFVKGCAYTSYTSYPNLVARGALNPPGSASQQPSLPDLDLSSAQDGDHPSIYSCFSRNATPSATVSARPHHKTTDRSPFQFIRMVDDVEKRYENMKSKKRALSSKSPRPLSNTIKTG